MTWPKLLRQDGWRRSLVLCQRVEPVYSLPFHDPFAAPKPHSRCHTSAGRMILRILGRLIAGCRQRGHNAFMPVRITIKGVSEEVRDELAMRAALRGQSMQEFLRCELERIASRPSVGAWLQGVHNRKAGTETRVPQPVSCAPVTQTGRDDRRQRTCAGGW